MNYEISQGDLSFLMDAFKYVNNNLDGNSLVFDEVKEIVLEAEGILNQLTLVGTEHERDNEFREFVEDAKRKTRSY